MNLSVIMLAELYENLTVRNDIEQRESIFSLSMAEIAFLVRSGLPFSQLVRIQLPVAKDLEDNPDIDIHMMPQPLPEHYVNIKNILGKIQACSSTNLPFTAWIQDEEYLQVACAKAVVVKVLKHLHSKQRELGIIIRDAKASINMQPIPQEELEQACSNAVHMGLLFQGWTSLGGSQFLGHNILDDADGAMRMVESVQVQVIVKMPDTVILLIKPEVLKIRHALAPTENTDLKLLARQHFGNQCCVLPDLRPALIVGIRSPDLVTLKALDYIWKSYGFKLPDSITYLIDVSFDADPDAPSFPYPPCCVLSPSGLDVAHNKLDSGPIQSILIRIRDEISRSSFGALGTNSLKISNARIWYPVGLPDEVQPHRQHELPPSDPFQSAKALAKKSANHALADAGNRLAFGPDIDIWSMNACNTAGGKNASNGGKKQTRKSHALPGVNLKSYIQKIRAENAIADAAAATYAAAKKAEAALAKAAQIQARYVPADKPAIPALKRVVSAARHIKGLPAGQKRAARLPASLNPRPPKAPKKGKVVRTDAQESCCAGPVQSQSEHRPNTSLPPGHQQEQVIGGGKQGNAHSPSEAMATVHAGEGSALPQNTIACTDTHGSTSGAATPGTAAVAKPVKPKAAPKALVMEKVMDKVMTAHAAGTMGTLTVPELKCYLKSVKKPVGGKKADLEERVRQHLSPEA